VTVAGQDPVALFERYPGRFTMWHVKDVAGVAEVQAAAARPGMEGFQLIMERIRAVGEGEIDFARIFAQAEKSGLRHFFVENDAPKDALVDIQTSHTNLSRLLAGR
jgi:sugar phosphate isomerase/epimerase